MTAASPARALPLTVPPRLCFCSLPRTSAVFVSLCINSVMVMCGMSITSDLSYPCLPLPLLLLPLHDSLVHPLPVCSPLPRPNLTPCLTFNPRMAPITRTCWCVRALWVWPPVSQPLLEASPAPARLRHSQDHMEDYSGLAAPPCFTDDK